MNSLRETMQPVRHGMAMALLALILGALWAVYIATHHEQLHGGFEQQESAIKQAEMQRHMQEMDMSGMALGHAHQHSHSGSLAGDAMQRLLRGHIHFMGIGILVITMLLLVAATRLKACWKGLFGWTFGLGALLYPPAWILMGFRTVTLGPEGAEGSVLWLFGPAVGLLIGSLIALLLVMLVDYAGLNKRSLVAWAFEH